MQLNKNIFENFILIYVSESPSKYARVHQYREINNFNYKQCYLLFKTECYFRNCQIVHFEFICTEKNISENKKSALSHFMIDDSICNQ